MKDKNKIASGFKTPPNYFQNFNQILKNKMEQESIIIQDNGFKVPENYFENFNSKVFQKLNKENNEKTKESKVINSRFWMSSAAAVLLLIGSMWFLNLSKESNPSSANGMVFENLDQSLINLYVEDYILPYEEVEVDLYSDFLFNDIAELDLNSIGEQEILDYLDDEFYDADFLNE